MKHTYIIERLHKRGNSLSKTIISCYTSKAKAYNRINSLGDELDDWNLSFDKIIDEPDYLRSTGYTRNNETIVYRVYKYILN